MHTVLRRPGEHWQLDAQRQLVVLAVEEDSVTLGLPTSAGVFQSAFRGRRGALAPWQLPRPRAGYFRFPSGGPCMFVVRVRSQEPVILAPGISVVAMGVQGDGVRLGYFGGAAGSIGECL